jgi:hypothetical protein
MVGRERDLLCSGVCRRHGEDAHKWHKNLALVFPFLPDEAEGGWSSQGNWSTAHLCMFYNGVDKIPMEPKSMCEEFPPEI